MITRDDWNAALDAWVEQERERLGGHPSPAEIAAYLRGELSAAESARVRALLVYYPELTPLLAKPRSRRISWVHGYAIAATLVVAFLAIQPRKPGEPVVPTSRHEFTAFRVRGPAPEYEIPAGDSPYQIVAVPSVPPADDPYRIQIVRDSQLVWSIDVRPLEDTFVIDIPGKFLKPGAYTMRISRQGELIERYPFRVVAR